MSSNGYISFHKDKKFSDLTEDQQSECLFFLGVDIEDAPEFVPEWFEEASNQWNTLGETNSQGLRFVSPEVGWVDQDEEYY